MKHRQFEEWILDEIDLSEDQKKELDLHLASCAGCQQLHRGWEKSKQMVLSSSLKTPAAGFTQRWQIFQEKKLNLEKVRRFRITLLGIVMLTFFGSLVYIIASGTFFQMIANVFTGFFQLGVDISHSLSNIGIFFSRLPTIVPISIGFIIFGMFNAFFITTLFTIWNVKNRKLQTDEISLD